MYYYRILFPAVLRTWVSIPESRRGRTCTGIISGFQPSNRADSGSVLLRHKAVSFGFSVILPIRVRAAGINLRIADRCCRISICTNRCDISPVCLTRCFGCIAAAGYCKQERLRLSWRKCRSRSLSIEESLPVAYGCQGFAYAQRGGYLLFAVRYCTERHFAVLHLLDSEPSYFFACRHRADRLVCVYYE